MISVISNAPVDLLAHVTDEFLQRHGLAKGVNTTITASKQAELLDSADYAVIPGGCGANVAATMAMLGLPVQFASPYNDDHYGRIAIQALTDAGVTCLGEPDPIVTTQIVFIFLTPDGDRSFAAYYDDKTDLNVAALERLIGKSPEGPVLIDGYKLLYPDYCRSISDFVTGSLTPNVPFVLCPNDVGVIDAVSDTIKTLYKRSTHIVMNQIESDRLFSDHNIVNPLIHMQSDGKIGAVTNGSRGAELFNGERVIFVPSALDPSQFVDSNGAGDAFTAGYMYGLVHGLSLEEQGHIAALCAAEVLSVSGARADADLATRIFKKAA